ncbi:MAG: hypothetical protein JXA96_12525 [Sedimentisphaerales bacterium]|nr:hypothetical protein [Sedimentisphaerales bacterium]
MLCSIADYLYGIIILVIVVSVIILRIYILHTAKKHDTGKPKFRTFAKKGIKIDSIKHQMSSEESPSFQKKTINKDMSDTDIAISAVKRFESHMQQITPVDISSPGYRGSDYSYLLFAMTVCFLGKLAFINKLWGNIPPERLTRWLPLNICQRFFKGDKGFIEAFRTELEKAGKSHYRNGPLKQHYTDLNRRVIESWDQLSLDGQFESKTAIKIVENSANIEKSSHLESGYGNSILEEVKDMFAKKGKIQAIKLYRKKANVGLREAKDTVEVLIRKEKLDRLS